MNWGSQAPEAIGRAALALRFFFDPGPGGRPGLPSEVKVNENSFRRL